MKTCECLGSCKSADPCSLRAAAPRLQSKNAAFLTPDMQKLGTSKQEVRDNAHGVPAMPGSDQLLKFGPTHTFIDPLHCATVPRKPCGSCGGMGVLALCFCLVSLRHLKGDGM